MVKKSKKTTTDPFNVSLSENAQKGLVRKTLGFLGFFLTLILGVSLYQFFTRPEEFPTTIGDGKVIKLSNGVGFIYHPDLKMVSEFPASWSFSPKPDLHSLMNIQLQSSAPDMAVVFNIMDLRKSRVFNNQEFLNLSWKNLQAKQVENLLYIGKETLPSGLNVEKLKFVVNPTKVGFGFLPGFFQGETYLFMERGLGFTLMFMYAGSFMGNPMETRSELSKIIHTFMGKIHFFKPVTYNQFIERVTPYIVKTPPPELHKIEEGLASFSWDLDEK